MTDAERKLLILCGTFLVRDTPITRHEADFVDELLAEIRGRRVEIGEGGIACVPLRELRSE